MPLAGPLAQKGCAPLQYQVTMSGSLSANI